MFFSYIVKLSELSKFILKNLYINVEMPKIQMIEYLLIFAHFY